MGRLKSQLELLDQLIRIPSITGDADACKEIIQLSKQMIEKQGVETKIICARNTPILIWGQKDLKKAVWLINTHLDVVPGKSQQFSPAVIKGCVFARGSADSKGNAAILISNAKDWNKKATDKNITFILSVDEESGGDSVKNIVKKMANLRGALFLEPTNEKIIAKAKGIMQIKIVTIGKPAHGSQPWKGHSSLEIVLNSLSRFLKAHPTPIDETQKTTFNFSILNSGDTINKVPSEAELWCDVRYNPKDCPDKILSTLKDYFQKSKVILKRCESPIDCPLESIICEALSKAVRLGGIKHTIGFDHGSSDARHCTKLNIPAVVFGPIGENLHDDRENVNLKSLTKIEEALDRWINLIGK